MFYAWDITVSAGTLEASPKRERLVISKGVITRIEVKFAPGCHGLVKVRIFHHGSQLVPLTKDSWLTGDDEPIVSEQYFEVDTPKYDLQFVGASPNCDYDHTITVRVTVLPPAVASILSVVKVLEKMYNRLFGR